MRNKFDDKLFNGQGGPQNLQNFNQFPFYEDHHDTKGNYVGGTNSKPQAFSQPVQQKAFFEQPKPMPQQTVLNQAPIQKNNPPYSRNYNNFVVFLPQTPDDVQSLIDYLKRREGAIVNLDGLDANRSQRILDMVSGAVYALNGSILRIAEHVNIFMITPEGVIISELK